jgi:UDP-glucose 4-epimerase
MNLAEAFGGKAVLITGGLGFIGSTLAYRLVELGSDVTIVDSLIPEYGGNPFNINGLEGRVRVNISDVRDRYSMNYLVQGKDYLFNLAGTLSHVDSMRNPFTDLEINCVAQLSILESCRLHNPRVKIVFAGTRGQYGKAQYLPVDERHPLVPIDVNGINNLAGEQYHILYHAAYGIAATSLRLTNTFGPRHQMKHPRQGIINWFIRQLLDGERIRLFGQGSQVRDTNYVDDVVDALLLAMASPVIHGQVYNLGGTPISLKDFVEMMIRIHGHGEYEQVPFPDDYKAVEVGDYVADYRKFQQATGWKPRVSLEDGVRRTFDYYIKHRDQYW